jgi:hypothetical protein
MPQVLLTYYTYWLLQNLRYNNREDVRHIRKEIMFTIMLSGLIVVATSAGAYAQTVNVTIGYPNNSNGDLGITSGSNWIGQFPITIATDGTTSSTEAYCLNYDSTIYEGSTYQANIAAANDTAEWRAVSYILSWYTPTDNDGAAIDQVAIWRLLDNYNPSEVNLPASIENAAVNLVAIANGKDVVRPGDQLIWVSPSSGNVTANPNQTVTFQVQLNNSTGAPRSNVQINFNATLQSTSGESLTLNSTYVNLMQSFTNTNGIAQVNVTVPSDTLLGSTIKVQASTQSAWSQEYLDLTSYTTSTQNLIGAGPVLNLTASTNISIMGFIMVLPESAYGALTTIVTFAAALIIYSKLKQPTKKAIP